MAKMIDLGLVRGVRALWQERLLHDYTIKVQGQQIKVHKVVLASVSEYFKAMLSEGFIESKADEVELKGLNASVVSQIMAFVYTGDEQHLMDDTSAILRCAMYLQMSSVVKFCVNKLVEDLDMANCLEALSVFLEYSFNAETQKVIDFIHTGWKLFLEYHKPEALSCGVMELLIDNWGKSEWDLFMFINDWYNGDPANRNDVTHQLFNQVRFCLIGQEQVQSIAKMDVFRDTSGTWHTLVEEALKYHELPIYLKVLERTEQAAVRAEPTPTFFKSGSDDEPSTFFTLDDTNAWQKHGEMLKTPPSLHYIHGIEVNNFFVVCARQQWYIFDPRTLTWTKIANMPYPKRYFALVHHNNHIYAVGRYDDHSDRNIGGMEQYDFQTNTWTYYCKLPETQALSVACVLGDTVYVTGLTVSQGSSPQSPFNVYCLELSSENYAWEKKPPSLRSPDPHMCFTKAMFVLKMKGEEGLVIFNSWLEMQFYSPSQNCWTFISNNVEPQIGGTDWTEDTFILARGNCFYILNVEIPGDDDEETFRIDLYYTYMSFNWTIPETGGPVTDVAIENFSVAPPTCGALLAIPPQPC